MKLIILKVSISVIISFISYSLNGQIRIGIILGDLEFKITPSKNVKCYYIYWHPFSSYMKKHLKSSRVLDRKVDMDKGREIKVSDYFENQVGSVERNFYKDTLLVKKVISNGDIENTETYYYNYDSINNHNISTKGYRNKKLIYDEKETKSGDSTIIHLWYIGEANTTYNTKQVSYYSKDSSILTSINQDIENGRLYCNYKKYDSDHKLLEEIDSSKTDKSRSVYRYDSEGRLLTINTDENSITEYNYLPKETKIIRYSLYEGGLKTKGKEQIFKFGEKHQLLFEETMNFSKSDNGKPLIEIGEKKFYNKGELIRVEYYNQTQQLNVYDIRYEYN